MKVVFGIGLTLLMLGLLSLVVAIPRSGREGVKVGGVALDLETRHEEKLSPIVSGVLILGGVAMLVAGRGRR
ncbi:MAG: hypothetical protein A2146_07225 [Actinobacteria bacterium RBG_16_67_10]|nr:MAG: hypothetical protein A2146_07225 [Actinobacteria bacterium RBG_16_67_10]